MLGRLKSSMGFDPIRFPTEGLGGAQSLNDEWTRRQQEAVRGTNKYPR